MKNNSGSRSHAQQHLIFHHFVDSTAPLPQLETIQTTPSARASEHADYIFVGTIITMDETMPEAEAMAIKAGRIIALGTAAEVLGSAGPYTKRVELHERVMYPGFVEAHMHLWVTALNYGWLDCGALANPSLGQVLEQLQRAVHAAEARQWILGKLFDPSLYDGFPELTRSDLDKLAPNNPVFILNASMHFAYVNSQALEVAGIADDSPDPPGGQYGRGRDGKLNGVLGELGAIASVAKHITKVNPSDIAANVAAISRDAAAVGVTTAREAGTGSLLGEKEITLLHQMRRAGQLKNRLSIALFDEAVQKWPDSTEHVPGAGDEYVWIGARKLVADGSNQGRSGYLRENYLGTNARGHLDMTPAELSDRLKWCNDNNWQVMVHANGDAAVEVVVSAFEAVLGQDADKKDLRHRIEHCSLVTDGVFEKMAKLGITPSFLINHVYYWGRTLRDNFLGSDRIRLLDRTASAARAGLRFSLHSDYNVSPIKPLHYVRVAATRDMKSGGHLNQDEKISVYQALKAVTIDAAWQIHAEDRLGSLAAGKYADFVILDRDPQKVADPTKIDSIEVLETWTDGNKVFSAAG